MKALLIADNKTAIDNVSQILESAGYDVIIYKWLIKALDNIEEICPHLIIVNAKDYPRHWKTLTQFASTSFGSYKPAVIVYAEGGLDEEEAQKAKALGVRGVFESVDVKGLSALREILAGKDDIYSGKLNEKQENEEEVISVDSLLNNESTAVEEEVVSEEESLTEENTVISEDVELTEDEAEISEEQDLTVDETEISEEQNSTENEAEISAEQDLTEEETEISEEPDLTEEESVVSEDVELTEDESVVEDEAVVSEEEALTEDEAEISEEQDLTVDETEISEEQDSTENESVGSEEQDLTEEESFTEDESVVNEDVELTENEALTEDVELTENEALTEDEAEISEEPALTETENDDSLSSEDDFSVFKEAAHEAPKYCSFAFTNPVSGVLVTGYATNFDGKSFEFNADIDDFVKNLDSGVQIPWGSIKIDQEFASVCATVKSNQDILVLELN